MAQPPSRTGITVRLATPPFILISVSHPDSVGTQSDQDANIPIKNNHRRPQHGRRSRALAGHRNAGRRLPEADHRRGELVYPVRPRSCSPQGSGATGDPRDRGGGRRGAGLQFSGSAEQQRQQRAQGSVQRQRVQARRVAAQVVQPQQRHGQRPPSMDGGQARDAPPTWPDFLPYLLHQLWVNSQAVKAAGPYANPRSVCRTGRHDRHSSWRHGLTDASQHQLPGMQRREAEFQLLVAVGGRVVAALLGQYQFQLRRRARSPHPQKRRWGVAR